MLKLFFFFIAVTGANASELDRAKSVNRSFSILQHTLNNYRTVQILNPKTAQDRTTGALPIPMDVLNQAKANTESVDEWGCQTNVVERPKQEVQFGENKIEVVPFDITINGPGCPVDVVAGMSISNPAGDKQSLMISTQVKFAVLDERKVDQFEMKSATMGQDCLLTIKSNGMEQHLEIGVTSHLDSEGGPQGHVQIDQGMKFSFSFQPPFSFELLGEDHSDLTINGQVTKLKSQMSMKGFSAPTSQYFINEAVSDQATYESTMQGLHYFGVNEKDMEYQNTLKCQFSIYPEASVSAASEKMFTEKGVFPTDPQRLDHQFCGEGKDQTLGSVSIATKFENDWVLSTLSSGGGSMDVYFLFDEDSHFVRTLDSKKILMSCVAVPKCSGGPQ